MSTERSWPVLLLLAGGCMLLTSLYLPWQSTGGCDPDDYFGEQGGTACGLLDYFVGARTTNGLSPDVDVGPVAALFALLLAGLGAAAWSRPSLARRLPLGRCALLASYFGVAVAVETRSDANQPGLGEAHYAYGAYVGLAATLIVLVAAGVERRGELARYRSFSRLAVLVLAGGLAGTFLLPWWESSGAAQFTWIGLATPSAVVAAALTLCLPQIWSRAQSGRGERLGLALAVALFTFATATGFSQYFAARAYGVLPALGIAGAFVALALVDGRRIVPLAEWSWHQLATGAAAVLFLASLFLPWQSWCYEANKGFGPLGGRCFSTSAWATTMAAAPAVLAIALAVAVLRPRRLTLSVIELAFGFGLLVATIGIGLEEGGGGGFRVERAYGSILGFTFAALLVALALMRWRPPTVDWRRLPVRLVPIAACAGYLLVVVLPWWDVLPEGAQSSLSFAGFYWLTIAGALLGIHLLGLWARQVAGASATAELVLVPLGMLALAAVELIAARGQGINWGGGAVVGLCLLLVALGRMEQRGGLESVRIPEILRVDRL